MILLINVNNNVPFITSSRLTMIKKQSNDLVKNLNKKETDTKKKSTTP